MFELTAIGPGSGQRFTKPLVENTTVRLGRAPADGWTVGWDMRISREHADITLRGDKLHVEVIEAARNPASFRGEKLRAFEVAAGEEFRIGKTRFRLEKAAAVQGMQTIDDIPSMDEDEPAKDPSLESTGPMPNESASAEVPLPSSDEFSSVDSEIVRLREIREQLQQKKEEQAKRSDPAAEMKEKLAAIRDDIAIETADNKARADAANKQSADVTDRLDLNELRRKLRETNEARKQLGPAETRESQKISESQNEYLTELLGRIESGPQNEFQAPSAEELRAAAEDPNILELLSGSHDDLVEQAMEKLAGNSTSIDALEVLALRSHLARETAKEDVKSLSKSEQDLLAQMRSKGLQSPGKQSTSDPKVPDELLDELKEQRDAKRTARDTGSSKKTDVHELKEKIEADAASARGETPIPESPVADVKSGDKPAPKGKPAKKTGKGGMSPEDIIAAAGGGKGKKENTKKPAGKKKASAADPLAAMAKGKGKPAANPKAEVWNRLSPELQAKVKAIADGTAPDDATKAAILSELNALIKDRDFIKNGLSKQLDKPSVGPKIAKFPKGALGIKSDWSEFEVRAGGHYALASLLPAITPRALLQNQTPTLNYMTRGEVFGEMGVFTKQMRSATCLAYDHPETKRKPGHVELVKINEQVFDDLVKGSPAFRTKVEALIATRRTGERAERKRKPWDADVDLTRTKGYRDLGLVQGQKLLLVDLERCTRCGDCMRACINTHDDGFSRLFLDGPRIDRFLVPSSCRQCLNPACMIGCPVSSIQKGGDGQIIIRDWCIGCGTCANQCPYDSIQMHDIGVIAENALGWRYAPESIVGSAPWYRPNYSAKTWANGAGPFEYDLAMRIGLQGCDTSTEYGDTLREPTCFRHEFFLEKERRQGKTTFQLAITTVGETVEVWLNGSQMPLDEENVRRKRTSNEFKFNFTAGQIKAKSKNLLAVRVEGKFGDQKKVLDARMDVVPESVNEVAANTKLVTDIPVVCDLCSSLPSKEPACVTQCPHDAAIRVDARTDLATMR